MKGESYDIKISNTQIDKQSLIKSGKAISYSAIASIIIATLSQPISSLAAVLPKSITKLHTDEIAVEVDGEYLGIGLVEGRYNGRDGSNKNSVLGNSRVFVQSIKPDAETTVKQLVRRGMLLVSVNGESVEQLGLTGAVEAAKQV